MGKVKKAKQKKDLYRAIIAVETEDECNRFLWDLLTPSELDSLSNRWQIALSLDSEEAKKTGERKTYKQIAAEIGTNPVTVGRVSEFLRGTRGKQGYRDILNKVKEQLES